MNVIDEYIKYALDVVDLEAIPIDSNLRDIDLGI